MRLKSKIIKALIIAVIIVIAVSLGYLLGNSKSNANSKDTSQSQKYPLLARRIFLEDPNDPIINFSLLRTQLQDYFTNNNLKGGIYFEYLPTGTSIRIDGDTLFTGASLIKLPAAMDLYRASELGRIDLDKRITLQQSWLDAAYGNLYQKGAGYQLTLREAAKIMLEDSDNTALRAIGSSVNGVLKPNEQSFNSLDVELKQDQNLMVSVSPRAYGSFLKCLYFACYLNYDHSQQILSYLSKTKFNTRLAAGVADKGITVAHKTGNFEQDTQSDCGIIYTPNRNYILCVMIKGQDNSDTDRRIAQISKITYSFITSVEKVEKP